MADPKFEAAVKAVYEEDKKLYQRSMAQYHDRMKGNPTPNQEEGDLAKLGLPVYHKKATGAGPEITYGVTRVTQAANPATTPAAGYTTRRAAAAPAESPKT